MSGGVTFDFALVALGDLLKLWSFRAHRQVRKDSFSVLDILANVLVAVGAERAIHALGGDSADLAALVIASAIVVVMFVRRLRARRQRV